MSVQLDDRSVQIEGLENGLTLAVEEQPWNPGVAMQFLQPVGATSDPEGLQGAANLIDSWLWKGSANRDARAFAEALDDLGARRGSAAGLEYASYAASFLAQHLERVLDLHADLLMRPAFPDEALEPVRQVALQELAALEDQPQRKIFAELRRAVFKSPHGRNPAGTMEGLQAATPDALREDFAQRFGVEGAVLALVGGVSFEQAKTAVMNTLQLMCGVTPEVPTLELSTPHSIEVAQDTAQVQLGLIYPDISFGHPEFYTARLAAQVLSGGMGSRLFTEVREKRGLVYSVYAGAQSVKGFSYLSAYGGTTPERSAQTLKVMRDQIEEVLPQGVEDDELERAKIGLRTALVMQEESARSRASSITRDLFMIGRVRTLGEIESQIAAIDTARMNRYLAGGPYRNPWIGVLGRVLGSR
jgi:predicted Zn-dependent peptidase